MFWQALAWYEEQLAGATDSDERAQLQELRDWVAAGNSPDSRWSALQSYDAVLAELPGLLVLLDDDARLRTRIAYLLAWFPEFSNHLPAPSPRPCRTREGTDHPPPPRCSPSASSDYPPRLRTSPRTWMPQTR
ncbi:hypothetical protein [Streptomyces sp. t99]|uniref:hypothetical protein n=1 Tax=Streptomyces sp. t99 TaxID=1828172 RepID=UPI000BFC3FCF|nr:hypothetical protein [Streptomyces sp. t99]